ncbi:MAG TPA: hypothetical protein VMR41_06015 [Patescibacteria group bacterium]|nr:hypothetical protein [Patescibacteria group bacterium]
MNRINSLISHHYIFALLVISICGVLGFFLSLKLALYGDDWLRLFYLKNLFDASRSGYSYFSIMSYVGPYNSQYPILFLVRAFSGYNPAGYFIASLTFRILGSFAFYFAFLKLTKNSTLALLGSLLLVTTPIGIQVTDWVFYMNTYVGLIPLSLTLYFLICLEEKVTIKNQFFILFFATLFILVIPVRSYGFVFALMLYTIGKIVFQTSKKRTFAIAQGVIILGIYGFVKVIGDIGPTTDVIAASASGLNQAYNLLLNHSFSFLIIPFSILGKQFLPDIFVDKLQQISPSFFQPEVIFFSLITVATLLIYFFTKKKLQRIFPIILSVNFLVYLIISVFFMSSDQLMKMYAEVALVIILDTSIFLWIMNKKKELFIISLLMIGFSLPYYILPWSFNPNLDMESSHRYMYFPEIGIITAGIYLTLIIFKSGNKYLRSTIISLFILAILVNILSDTIYFRSQLRFRDQERFTRIFTSFKKVVPTLPKDKQTVFYITDLTGIRNDVYTFGFPFHIGLIYGFPDDRLIPFIILNKEQLVSAATDGKSLKLYTRYLKKINYNDVIYLKLLPNDTFVNNKSEILKQIHGSYE